MKSESVGSEFGDGSPHHTGVKNALAKILDDCRVKSKEVPDNRNKIEGLVNILMAKMNKIDPLFESMKPGCSQFPPPTKHLQNRFGFWHLVMRLFKFPPISLSCFVSLVLNRAISGLA